MNDRNLIVYIIRFRQKGLPRLPRQESSKVVATVHHISLDFPPGEHLDIIRLPNVVGLIRRCQSYRSGTVDVWVRWILKSMR